MNALSVLQVARVIVTVEMADGTTHSIESRPDSINQEHGVQVNENTRVGNDFDLGLMVDLICTRTVTWVEQWTET